MAPRLRMLLMPILDQRAWWLSVTALLIGSLLLASHELNMAPLEYHEAYVVQTAQEMRQRNDWIVPYFNGEPRLRKPPLSYWLTALSGRLWGDVVHLEPRHGRIPSALAGLGIVVIVLWMGRSLYDRETGLMAGAMMASSLGFFHYTHSARADMVYAFWSTAGLAALVHSWRTTEEGQAATVAPVLMWSTFAFATLTKGPQIPAMFLLGFAAWVLVERIPLRRAIRCIRPITGFALYLALTAPWWGLVHDRMGGDGVLGTQLSGTLLRFDWTHGIALDYTYRLPQLLIPWFVLLPVLLRIDWNGSRSGRESRLIGIVILVTIVLLSLGPQQRVFYLLPIVAPTLLLIAAGTRRILTSRSGRGRFRRVLEWLGPGYWLLMIIVLATLLAVSHWIPTDLPPGTMLRAGVLLVILLGAGAVFGSAFRDPDFRATASVFSLAALFFAIFWGLGTPVQTWSKGRSQSERLGHLASTLTPQEEVLTWGVFPDPFVYYARVPVRELESRDEVLAALNHTADRQLIIIAKAEEVSALPPYVRVQMLDESLSGGVRELSLVRLSRGRR